MVPLKSIFVCLFRSCKKVSFDRHFKSKVVEELRYSSRNDNLIEPKKAVDIKLIGCFFNGREGVITLDDNVDEYPPVKIFR
ncbi:hypothetical protein CXK86_20705 [Paenibacillus sp. BGI2013]|nr:hypothetical protein CXK86_20705 [Paenibacillus sp. BGI2013]